MKILRKEILQFFALSTQSEMIAKDILERKGKKVQKGISAKDIG
jgi:hypothetical protein